MAIGVVLVFGCFWRRIRVANTSRWIVSKKAVVCRFVTGLSRRIWGAAWHWQAIYRSRGGLVPAWCFFLRFPPAHQGDAKVYLFGSSRVAIDRQIQCASPGNCGVI